MALPPTVPSSPWLLPTVATLAWMRSLERVWIIDEGAMQNGFGCSQVYQHASTRLGQLFFDGESFPGL